MLSDFYYDHLSSDFFEYHNEKLEHSLLSLDYCQQKMELLSIAGKRMNFAVTERDFELETSYRYKKEELLKEQVKRFEDVIMSMTLELVCKLLWFNSWNDTDERRVKRR